MNHAAAGSEGKSVAGAVKEALEMDGCALARRMFRRELRQERKRALIKLALWMTPWSVSTTLTLTLTGGWQFAGMIVAVSISGRFGESVLALVPVKTRVDRVFGWSGAGDWSNLSLGPCSYLGFKRLLKVHGIESFWPRNQVVLAWALERGADIGEYPAMLLRHESFFEAGIGEWVRKATDGALEMAKVLCALPEVGSLNELVSTIHRIGKKSPQTPARS